MMPKRYHHAGKILNKVACPIFLASPVLGLILAACDSALPAKSAFEIKDSGVPAAEGQLGWLDKNRVIFSGYEPERYRVNPDGSKVLVINAIFIWDTSQNKVTKYASIEGPVDLCVHKGSISYARYVEQEKALVLISGKIGEEQKTHLPEKRWFNRLSCQYFSTRPFWALEGREVEPLLEEHGYLDFGVWGGNDRYQNTPIVFYPRGMKEGIILPIGRREIGKSSIRYVAFKNAYFMYGDRYVDVKTRREYSTWPNGLSQPLWWLTGEGKLTEIPMSHGRAKGKSSVDYFPVRDGIFMVSHDALAPSRLGDAGGYLVQGEQALKLITGLLLKSAVSPDGCSVAFVHDPYDTERGKERFGRITVKMLDLCRGGIR